MYEIKRKGKIKETVKVSDNDGKELILAVDINIDDILGRYNIVRNTMNDAQAAAKKHDEEAAHKMGSAIVSLFDLLFGTEQTRQLVAFYDNRYTEMLADLMPFLSDAVLPKINEAMQSRAAQYKAFKKK